jgi:NADH:ubiquinone oxidoreductase subunit C
VTPEALVDYLADALGDRVVDTKVAYGQIFVTVQPEAWVDAARLCKEDRRLACNYWEFLDAVDRSEDGFEVVTHLYSVEHRHGVTLKAAVPGGREKPVMPSLSGIFRGANWSERETYDMFGIEFEGHPRLEPRILSVENFEGWPLRKDFLLSTREAKPWPGSKEPEERKADDTAGSPTAGEAPVSAEEKAAAAKAKAERAKAKAAAMRAKKAEERAAAQRGEEPDQTAQAEAAAAQMATTEEAEDAAAAAEAVDQGEVVTDPQADAADATGGGDTTDEAAGVVAAAAGEPEPQTPEGAAEIADSAIAKDAAAGAVQGDVAAGAPGDEPNVDQPVHDPEAEAAAGEGAPETASGTPGVEARGRTEGALEQSGDSPGVTPLEEEQDSGPETSETEDEGRLRESGADDPEDER